jgi:ParB family chromosome partitioning protein
MSSKANQLGTGASFGSARPVSARRAAIAAVASAPTLGAGEPTELPTELISRNPDNPRDSIGLVQAITVASAEAYLKSRPERASDLAPGAHYVVVDGHRRHAAAQQAELPTIKVSINDALVSSDETLLEAAFVANAQRENMTDLEEAQALEKLVAFYGSQGKAAKRLGMTQANISQRLSLLALAPELQSDLDAGRRKVEHVRGLAKLPPQEQKATADARAAEAQRRVEEEKRRREEKKLSTAADEGTTDNAVMSPAAGESDWPSTGTHNGVIAGGVDEPANGKGSVVVRPPASEGSRRSFLSRSAADPDPMIGVAEDALPWDRPVSILRVLSVRMAPDDFEALLKMAAGMVEEIQRA